MTTLIKDGVQIDLKAFSSLYPNQTGIKPEDKGWSVVFPVPPPVFNLITQAIRLVDPVLTSKGTWEQQWEIVDQDEETIAINQASEDARLASLEAQRIERLWQAAHDYEYAGLNGSAVGLVTLGVLQGLPKCQAVQAWLTGIWATYYERKGNRSTDIDFTGCGPMPHTIPELMAELGV